MPSAYEPFLESVLIDESTLQTRVRALGAQISADYDNLGELLLVCILKGGVMFLSDLTRHITLPHEIDFMAVKSYHKGDRKTSRVVRIERDLEAHLENKHVLIVEDIIDSGLTLEFVLKMLEARNPASIKLCTLLNKASRREVNIPVQYVGFEIEDKFVFGYGLDLDEKFRNMPFIGVAKLS
jgi:hypoxanthine phosphoribosyltransferase